jgi:hypothetical protein
MANGALTPLVSSYRSGLQGVGSDQKGGVSLIETVTVRTNTQHSPPMKSSSTSSLHNYH